MDFGFAGIGPFLKLSI